MHPWKGEAAKQNLDVEAGGVQRGCRRDQPLLPPLKKQVGWGSGHAACAQAQRHERGSHRLAVHGLHK